MRLLFLGDVVGRAGRNAISERLPAIRKDWRLDFIVVNGENSTGGMGLSKTHAELIFEAGADCITLGDHAFDQRDMMSAVEQDQRILRPINYATTAPGVGARMFTTERGQKVYVAQALGQVFMKRPFADPFSALDAALKKAPLGGAADAVIVDFHAEATSEKMAMGHWLDGRASLVVGTHTHVPTSDTMIMPKGTAYQTDAGMCGDYHSVIGMDTGEPLNRFLTGMSKGRFTPADGEATLSGVYVETDRKGKAVDAVPVRVGGQLRQQGPTV